MKSRWKTYLLAMRNLIVLGIFVFIIYQLIIIFYPVPGVGFSGKTFWDWMELLIIPLVLAAGAFFLNRSERTVEHQATKDRADLEREIAKDRQQEQALQAYLDRMSELLLDNNLRTTKDEEVRDVARTRTLSVLRGLDTKRKSFILLFLKDSGLIHNEKPAINLAGADMRGADLLGASLSNADLQRVNLAGANLSGAGLVNTKLHQANLENANLEWGNLLDTDLSEANLSNALLAHSVLAQSLLERAWLIDANLSDAELFGASMYYAHMSGANLSNANLTGANLESADLTKANLHGAKVSNGQLETAKSLKGATMPDGTIHE